MTHYNDIISNKANIHIDRNGTLIWLLNDTQRVELVHTMLDAINLINGNTQQAAAYRANLIQHDYDILNCKQNLNDKGEMLDQQSLFWKLVPICEGGLGEDLNSKQLAKLNKAFKKLEIEPLNYIQLKSLNDQQMYAHMEKFRYMRKHHIELQNELHFNKLFNRR